MTDLVTRQTNRPFLVRAVGLFISLVHGQNLIVAVYYYKWMCVTVYQGLQFKGGGNRFGVHIM